MLLHSNTAGTDPLWAFKSSAKKFKGTNQQQQQQQPTLTPSFAYFYPLLSEALRVLPGGHAELFAHCYTLYKRAELCDVVYKAIRLLGTSLSAHLLFLLLRLQINTNTITTELATHTLEYLCSTWPDDYQSKLLYADVTHLAGHVQNNAALLSRATKLYEHCIDHFKFQSLTQQAQCLYQASRCYYRLHLLSGRGTIHLTHRSSYCIFVLNDLCLSFYRPGIIRKSGVTGEA